MDLPRPPLPTYEDVAEAAHRLKGMAHHTPVLRSSTADALLGAELFFKCENLQRMGAFKFRGAFNALVQFSDAQRKRGVLAFSSGNHAQAIALSARLLQMPAVIVMPENVFTIFSWCPQGSKKPQSRRAPQTMLAAWTRCATTSAAFCCLARRVVPKRQRLRRCKSSPGHQPGCGLRLASTAFAGQRAP